MTAARLRRVITLAIVAGCAVVLLRLLRGDPAPAFERQGSRPQRPGPAPRPAPVPVAAPAEGPGPVAAPGPDARAVPAEQPAEQPADEPAVEPDGGPGEVGPAAAAAVAAEPQDATWVDPVEGACPPGYPVKVKLRSGIYHAPGAPTYERTRPDRCYPSAEAAEADGFRAPKRR